LPDIAAMINATIGPRTIDLISAVEAIIISLETHAPALING